MGGKAFIDEFLLDGVHFDRFKGGVLGVVKGNYGFAARIGQYKPNLKAVTDIVDEARRQIAVARKHNLPLEWHVCNQDLQGFERLLGPFLDDINLIGY